MDLATIEALLREHPDYALALVYCASSKSFVVSFEGKGFASPSGGILRQPLKRLRESLLKERGAIVRNLQVQLQHARARVATLRRS